MNVKSFWIDRTEVTNGQYEAFLTECPLGSGCGPQGLPDYWEDQSYLEDRRYHPVVFVSWEDASAFCRWEEGRLPSAQEWERAARGGDKRIYPSGNQIDPASVNILGKDRRDEKRHAPRQIATWGVNDKEYTHDRSPYGVLAMAGNVSEWTASDSDEVSGWRLAAGGSFDSYDPNTDGRGDHRLAMDPTRGTSSLGFRCAFSFEPAINSDALRVAAEPDTPPMLIKDEKGNYGGFDWEIAKAIAKRIGVDKVEIVAGKYSELPGRLS
ncbi:MAG TPA: SUMF1/EgtB/PvdO family nonheme iron enzyme, partial [Thermoanaerobaculia bacterium]|nr:SUMF1/EgtB/PvdO family nonheme iron enzyme [Thermoanaerobaculia bacterium]